MRLCKLSEFRRTWFTPASAPSPDSLRESIRLGEIPGGMKLGRRYFVDLDEFDRAMELRKKIDARRAQLAAEPLLAGLI